MDFFEDTVSWENIDTFEKAYAIAKDAHKKQMRDEGAPYIVHIDGTIDILKKELKIRSEVVLAVAALHDVCEDSDTYGYEDINKLFGNDIATAVELLTKKENQGVDGYLQAIDDSQYAAWLMLVKLSDRLHNIRSLKLITDKNKQIKKINETKKYYMKYAKKYSNYVYSELEKALNELEKSLQ